MSFVLGYLNSRQSKIQTQEMLDVKETVEELPEEEPGEATYTEDIGVDISETGE